MFFIVLLIIIILAIVLSVQGEKKKRERLQVPKSARKITYFTGYDKKMSNKLYYWKNGNHLNFCDTKEKNGPVKITIPKENILAFTSTGEITTQTNVKGGGPSLGGAVVGAAVAGPVGAIVGGKKKVKTQTTTTDTRRTFIKFAENGTEKSMQFDYSIYDDLCLMCLERKI